jgi:hypothetical protein
MESILYLILLFAGLVVFCIGVGSTPADSI